MKSLCETCQHQRRIENRRGSVFWMCRLSATDARFPKYPPQPVLRCSGYVPADDGDAEDDADRREDED